jgi:hypothetical protein
MLCIFTVVRLGGGSRGSVEHLEGKGGDSVMAISGFLYGSSRLCRLRTAPF